MTFRLSVMIDAQERPMYAASRAKAVNAALRIVCEGFVEETDDGRTIVYPPTRVQHIEIVEDEEREPKRPRVKR